MSVNGITTSNTLDLVMGGFTLSGGKGAYFVSNAASYYIRGKDLGQHIDDVTEKHTGQTLTEYINGQISKFSIIIF